MSHCSTDGIQAIWAIKSRRQEPGENHRVSMRNIVLRALAYFWNFMSLDRCMHLRVAYACLRSPWNLSFSKTTLDLHSGLLVPLVAGSCLPDAIPPENRKNLAGISATSSPTSMFTPVHTFNMYVCIYIYYYIILYYIILHYIILYCIVLYYIILYYIIPYAALFTTLFGLEYIQCSVLSIAIPIVTFSVGPMWHLLQCLILGVILYCIVLYCIILYYITLYYIILYYIYALYVATVYMMNICIYIYISIYILYYIILYYIILYYIILYYIILYYIILYYIILYLCPVCSHCIHDEY